MISEFVWLDFVEQTQDCIHCSCSLPDPDPYSDEEMVVCGDVLCSYDAKRDSNAVEIRLFDNFKKLCIGDSYQRKDFVQTIIFVLNMKFGANIQNATIHLWDCWGMYSGDLDFIDEVIRGTD